MADNVKLPEGAVFLDEQEVRPPEGSTFLDEVPTGSNVDIKKTKRALIDSDFGDRENEARVAVGAYMAHQLKMPFNGANDYAGMADAYFGGKGIVPANQAAKKLKDMLAVQEQPDALDELDAIDDEEKKLEKAADLALPSFGTRLWGWFAGGDESPHRLDPRTLKNRPDLKEKLLVDARINALQGSRKRRLQFHSSMLSDNAKRFAEATMLTEKGNILQFNQLSPKDKRFFYGYLRELEPEIDERYSTEFVQALDNASKRTAHAFKSFAEVTTDTIAGRQSPFQIYTFIKNKYRDEKIDGKPIFTKDGRFASEEARAQIAADMKERFGDKVHAMQMNQPIGGAGATSTVTVEDIPEEEMLVLPDMFEQGRKEFEERAHERAVFNSTMERFKESGFMHDNSLKATEMLLDMGLVMSTSAATFGVGGVAYSAARFQGEAAQDLVFNHGVSHADANIISWCAAAPYAATERIQVAQLSKGAQGFLSGWKTGGKKALMSALAKHGANYASEVSEETVQSIFEQSAKLYAKEYAAATGVDFDELMKEVGTEFIEAAKTMPFLTAPGAAADIYSAARGGSFNVDSAKEELARIDAEKVEPVKIEDIDTVSEEVKDEYDLGKTTEEKIETLEEAGIENAEQVHEQIQEEEAFEEEVATRLEPTEQEIVAREQRFDDLRIAMEELGVERKLVDQLSSTLDPENVGQYANSVIEVKDGIADTTRVFNHEVFHFLRDSGQITDKEWEALQAAAAKPEYKALNLRYSSFEGDARVEEVMADAWATFTPEERSVWKKVVDYIKSFFAVKTEKQVFQRLDEYLQSAAKAGRAKGLTGEFDTASAAAVKLGVQRVSDKPDTQQERFARNGQVRPDARDNAARVYALAKAEGSRNLDKIAQSLSEQTGSDARDIAAIGESLYEDSVDQLDEGATRLQKRVAIQKRSAERSIRSELRKAQKAGVRLAKEGTRAKERIAKDKAKRLSKEMAKAHTASKEYLDQASIDKSMSEAIESNKVTPVLNSAAEAAKRYAEANDIASKAAKDAVYKATLYHTLWFGAINKMKFDRSKSALKSKIDKMLDKKTNALEASKIAGNVFDSILEVKNRTELKELTKDFKAILNTKANKRVKSTTLLKDREISPEKAAELSIIKSVWQKGDKVLAPLLSKIENALHFQPSETSTVTVEEFQQDALDTIAKKIPAIKDDSIIRELDTGLQLIMLQQIISDYGNLKNKGVNAIAEATMVLQAEIDESARTIMEIAKKQSELIKINRERANIATKPVRKGVKSAFSGGAIWGSIQSRLRDMTRVSSDAGKKAMELLIQDLDFQGASSEFDKLKGDFAQEWQEVFVNAYNLDKLGSFARIQKRIIDLNVPRKKWAKYTPDGSELSTGQVMQIVATHWQGVYEKQLENAGYTFDKIESMQDALSNQDIAFLNSMVELYSEWGKKLDSRACEVYGTSLSNQSGRYLPVVMDVVRPYNAMETRSVPLLPPSFNKRNPGKNSIIDTTASFFEVLDGKVNENAHWISHVNSSLLARSVFNGSKLTRQLVETYGSEAVRFLHEHLNDIYSNQAVEAVKDPVIRRLSSIVSMRYLSGSLKQIFTQPMSFPAFAHNYGIFKGTGMFVKGVFTPRSYIESFAKLWKSDQFKSRRKLGQTEYIETAMRQRFGDNWVNKIGLPENAKVAAGVVSTAIKQMYKMGMVTNTLGDAIPIMAIGPTIYMEELRRARGNEELAMKNTWDAIESNQQSHAVKDRSRLSRRGGLAAQLVGQFINTPGQYAAFEVAAYKQLRDDVKVYGVGETLLKRESTKKLLNALIINHVMLPGLFYGMSTLFNNFLDDDDWDEDDTIGMSIQALSGPASAHMVSMALSESFLYAALTGKAKWGRGMIPLQSFIKDAKMMGVLIHHLSLDFDLDEAFEDAVDLIPEFVAPVRQVKRAVKSRQ